MHPSVKSEEAQHDFDETKEGSTEKYQEGIRRRKTTTHNRPSAEVRAKRAGQASGIGGEEKKEVRISERPKRFWHDLRYSHRNLGISLQALARAVLSRRNSHEQDAGVLCPAL
jgi:hypothetical protein